MKKVIGILCLSIFSLLLCGCDDLLIHKKPRPEPKWKNGEFVRSVLSGEKGQVIFLYCWNGQKSCFYDVRFMGVSMITDTRLITADGKVSIVPLTEVEKMHEFELKSDK